MRKSNLNRLELILRAFYDSGRYVLAILSSIALVWLTEAHYGTQEVAMSLALHFFTVGVTASALFNWIIGERK